MDAVSDPAVRTLVVMSSAQVGKTEILNNIIGFHIDRDPAPILVLQPTLDMAQAWSKDRLAPMLRDTPALRGKVKDARSRDSANTVLHKVFPGGHITVTGANSPASLRSRPIRLVLCDEVDVYGPSAGTEGDAVALAAKRSMTFWNRKLVLTSTPTVKDASRIEQAWERSDQRRFFVLCPHCQRRQVMRWPNVRWEPEKPETAAYHCEECDKPWSEAQRLSAVIAGEWRASKPFTGTAGFHLNALISPWVTLGELAREFVEAKDFPDRLKVFVNTALGELWEERGVKTNEDALLARRESFGAAVPKAVAVIVAGVDVQDDRLEVEILGVGRGEETWSLDYRTIRGDPSTQVPWNDLDRFLFAPRKREDGVDLGLGAAAVDTGGHHTQAAYVFCRDRYGRRVWAIKGASETGKPIWPKKPTRSNIGQVPLFIVGTHAAKDLVAGRLRIDTPGPGYCHFPLEREPEYFAQLASEKVVTRYGRKGVTREWIKASAHARNEAWDCRVYAMCGLAGLLSMGLDLQREAERLDALAQASSVGASPQNAGLVARRRVRSPGVPLYG
jgi:phage terminase large subunit GpA-like protein